MMGMKTVRRVQTLVVVVLAFVAATLVSPRSYAAPPAWPDLSKPPAVTGGGERDAALVVAIQDYAKLAPIPGAEQNGQDWYRWLTRTRGIRPDRVRLARNGDATVEDLRKYAAEVTAKVAPGGTLWVVFIGHGAPSQDGHDGVLVGWDAQQKPESFYARSLGQKELVGIVRKGKQASTLLVVDACFSGRGSDGEVLAKGLQPTLLADRAREMPARVTVLAAGTSSQFAGPLPAARRPAFSYLVLGALRGWGDRRQYGNDDGKVTAKEAVDYARAALDATLRGRDQTPELAGDGGDTVMARAAREEGPDLAALAEQSDEHKAGEPSAERPKPPSVRDDDVVRPKASEESGRSVGDIDLEAYKQQGELATRVEEAKRLSKDDSARAEDKARAWERVAELEVKGGNPFRDKAKAAAVAWRREGARQAELVERRRAEWKKVAAVVQMPGVSKDEKLRLVRRFVEAWKGAAGAAELEEAKGVLAGLQRGEEPSAAGVGGMVRIPAGTFWMGSADGEGEPDEHPRRQVTLTRAFMLDATEVTVAAYRKCVAAGPCAAQATMFWDGKVQGGEAWCTYDKADRTDHPMNCVDWTNARSYCGWAGKRLPTEAEWEYAARGGLDRKTYPTGDDTLDDDGWYKGNSGDTTHPVAQKRKNGYGLYDMAGNVWEWVEDGYDAAAYTKPGAIDPIASGDRKSLRGGSWYNNATSLRVAFRNWGEPTYRNLNVGFRCARTL